ncbi:unnamed protein product [Calypogeia fissa]
MTMVSPSSASVVRWTSALPAANSMERNGFRSREIWEMSHTSSAIASVSSSENLRSSAQRMALKASVSSCAYSGKELSSSFWGSEKEDNKFHRSKTGRSRRAYASRVPRSMPLVVEARLFGPSIFNASKLRVLLLGKDDPARPLQHPRIYTLTHSDITAKITLAVAREINKSQVMGWYSKFQRDEVVAEWRKAQGEISLHVHCHISGTNFLHKLIAKLRFEIFQKELPLVLEAFIHGDKDLFEKHPELENAAVWVYFHSNVEEFNRVECWGPLVDAIKRHSDANHEVPTAIAEIGQQFPGAAVCLVPCDCCSRYATVIPIPESLSKLLFQSLELSMQGKPQSTGRVQPLQNPHDHGSSK